MTAEISDLQKKRAYNQIWNAAANYGFQPDFRFYTPEGKADVYWNTIIGLARKHYDYDQLKKLFRGLEQEEEAGEYENLVWLGLENALVTRQFADLLDQYTQVEELDTELLNRLIDKIIIGDRIRVDGEIKQKITIQYKFVGAL